jgi:hypothetical protein
MNRRGRVAYCLAGWICGSTFASVAIWIRNRGVASPILNTSPAGAGFFFFCFVGLILGFVPALLESILLMLIARTFRLRRTVAWAIAGMMVAVGATAVLGRIGGGGISGTEPWNVLELLTQGPALLIAGGWWMPAIPGALTGVVLSRVQAAFSAGWKARAGSSPPPSTNATRI